MQMATTRRRAPARLIDRLQRLPARFDFFQAVRVLNWFKRRNGEMGAVGRDRSARNESVRFRTKPSLSFPDSTITELKHLPDRQAQGQVTRPAEMQVSFLGLVGTGGVLPEHYTELIIQRARYKDYAFRDFLDIFNHRAVSLFYRAWEKYRLPLCWERAQVSDPETEEAYTLGLRALVGMGTGHLSHRLTLRDDFLLFFSGHFAQRPRSAIILQQMLEAYLGVDVEVRQFQGRWLDLTAGQQTRLPNARAVSGQFNQLGVDAVVGRRAWDVSGKFRLRLGPLGRAQFEALMPGGRLLAAVCELTRLYAGIEFDFDVQLVVQADKVPCCQLLRSPNTPGPRLQRNAWLAKDGLSEDADEAVYVCRV